MTQWGLDTLFNPAKRHMDEEKQRLQSTREEVGDASGGKRIDLESGKVTIRRGGAGAEASARTDTDDGAELADVEEEPGELTDEADDSVDAVDGDTRDAGDTVEGDTVEPEPADIRED